MNQASTTVKTYDPTEVTFALGVVLVTDFEEIGIDQDEDNWSHTAGSSGEITETRTASTLTTVTLSLTQTSDFNTALSAIHTAGIRVPLFIKDHNGSSVLAIPNARITKPAPKTFNKSEANTSDWIIKGPADLNITGGNN